MQEKNTTIPRVKTISKEATRAPQRSNWCVGQSPEVCGKFVLEGFGPCAWWRERSPMAGVGFLQSLWEKPISEGVWPYLDPMDSVCLRTASVEWTCAREVRAAQRVLFLPD